MVTNQQFFRVETVFVGNSNLPITTATFSTNGVYDLRLLAEDGQLTNASEVHITVYGTNTPPHVNAGPSQTVLLPAPITNFFQFQQIEPETITNLDPYFETEGGGMDYLLPSNCIVATCSSHEAYSDTVAFFSIGRNGKTNIFTTSVETGAQDSQPGEPIATARDTLGGFAIGEMFCGDQNPGEVMRVEPNGALYGGNNGAWVVLTNSTINETMAGYDGYIAGLSVDRTGVWGGNLIVATLGGDVWRIDSSGNVTLIVSGISSLGLGNNSGLTTISNNVPRYGPWSGRILIEDGSENCFAIDTNGFSVKYQDSAFTGWDGGYGSSSIACIPQDHDLFGIDLEGHFWSIPSSQFRGMIGDVLFINNILENSYAYPLYKIHWDGNALDIVNDGALYQDQGNAGFFNPITFFPASTNIERVQLHGSIEDDGQLFSPTSNLWFEVSGPGPVSFDDPTLTNTFVGFASPGTYILRLAAFDGQFTSYDDVLITVVQGQSLMVDAGTNQFITMLNTTLNGLVTSTTWPSNQLALSWSQLSGPPGGAASFAWTYEITNASSVNVTNSATFNVAGIYVLQLTANDGQAVKSADVTVSVQSPYLILTPNYGWPTVTNTSFTVTATLMDSNNIPVTNVEVNFYIAGINGNLDDPYDPSGSYNTGPNGSCPFSYTGTNQGRDEITAMATVDGQSVSSTIAKDWASAINCGMVLTNNGWGYWEAFDDWSFWPESESVDFLTNNGINYADYYSFTGTGGTTIALSLAAGNLNDLALIIKNSSNNIVATGGGTITEIGLHRIGGQLTYTLPSRRKLSDRSC